MSRLVMLEDRGAYALLRLNRADKRNAMNTEARAALRRYLRDLQGTHRVVVVTGTGESFCSGMDLKEFAEAPAGREAASREWIDTLLEIRRHPAIVIAAVNGIALGGGASLINVSDLAIAAEEAEIGLPEMSFGTYAAMAGPSTQLMLTAKRAAWLVLTAKRIDGRTAERWGLVNECVPRTNLEDSFDALARHVAQFDAQALAEAKRALDTVPRRLSEWQNVFEYGQAVNLTVRARRATAADVRASGGQTGDSR